MTAMKKNKKISGIALLAIMIITPLSVLAQSEEQVQQLEKKRKEYFTKELKLTEAEAEVFWPIYSDLQNRKVKIMEEERNIMRYTRQNEANLSEEEVKTSLDRIQVLKGQMFELEKEYYGTKFPEILPPKKAIKLHMVEWDFRRHLMKEIRGRGPGGAGSGKGPPHGQGRRSQLPASGE